MKKTISLGVLFVAVMIALVCGLGTGTLISGDVISSEKNKYGDILSIAQRNYISDVDPRQLTEGAATELLSKLDPFSKYLPVDRLKKERDNYRGSYVGAGLQLFSIRDTIIVNEVTKGGPAAKQGILSNDRIIAVDDSSVIGRTVGQTSQRLLGTKGSPVTLTIVRNGAAKPMMFRLVREDVPMPSVDAAYMLTDEIGYLSINGFIATTHSEVADALTKLKSQGMRSLVIDLRDNPGGYVHEAVNLADQFLDGGKDDDQRLIVQMNARNSDLNEVHYAQSGEKYEDLPIVVLVNGETASAAEIFSGAMQDWDRALIVGETTYGKGLVQRQWTLEDGSAIRLTIGKYSTPSGRIIQRPYEGHDMKPADDLSHRPVFTTEAGRKVYGGGGIMPDTTVTPYASLDVTKKAMEKSVLLPFVSSYIDREGASLRKQYSRNLVAFDQSFEINDEMLEEFVVAAKKKGLDGAMVEKDGQYIRARIKAQVAKAFWGYEGWSVVMSHVDPQIRRAMELIPSARQIAGLEKHLAARRTND